MNYDIVIGIEIHVQLKTCSKIFSGASTQFGAAPNTQACALDIALPGTLPVLNKKAVEYALRFGLSVNAHIAPYSVFARKNYFYPDLPKGYQISQFELPIVGKGSIDITLGDNTTKTVGITRAHLEEDAGKSIHDAIPNATGVDLNRAGTPLLEIVSEPDMHTAIEAIAYCKTIHRLVTYIGICDGNMQEGSFRCDINISLKPKGTQTLGTRTELKNLNSFRFIEKAIAHEVARQADILDDGGSITQETRLYDPDLDETRSMRSKEDAHDYRYFPDPDLLPLEITQDDLERIKSELPDMPWTVLKRYKDDHDLNHETASTLSDNPLISAYFEECTALCANVVTPKVVANWITGELLPALHKANLTLTDTPVSTADLCALMTRIHDGTLSNTAAKTVFEALFNKEGSVDTIINARGLKQMNDSGALEAIIDEIIANSPSQVADYKAGKTQLMAYFVGQAMKATKGRANPKAVNACLKERLGN
jgi:aspartyl-tRNA(Asn)/glutamyl-tRNA(Gln) amidotransferase subunit B